MQRSASRLAIALIATGISVTSQASAAPAKPTAADFATLQQQINALRGDYETKISELETRLKAAEAEVAAAKKKTAKKKSLSQLVLKSPSSASYRPSR